MKKIEIVISGQQIVGVGYRSFLLLNAVQSGISKVFAFNVENSGRKAVVVRVEGDQDKVDQYVGFAKSARPTYAAVDNVEVSDFEGEVMDAFVFMQILQFELIRDAVEVIGRLESAIGDINQTISYNHDNVIENLDNIEQNLADFDETKGQIGYLVEKIDEIVPE